MRTDGAFDGLREKIFEISDALTDVAIESLRSAAETNDEEVIKEATLLDRRVVRARRALEKAAAILASIDE